MKAKHFFSILGLALLLTGCASLSNDTKEIAQNAWADTGSITVGGTLTVEKSDSRLELLDNMDALTADGLYYAAWTIGDSEAYENSEGKTVDLYDAQIYLLLGEFPDETEAEENRDTWMDAAKSNYEVLEEDDISCNGQDYSLITYNCVNKDNPYDHGASAFAVCGEHAVCIELTCRENFDDDLKMMLVDFLENCTFNNE